MFKGGNPSYAGVCYESIGGLNKKTKLDIYMYIYIYKNIWKKSAIFSMDVV